MADRRTAFAPPATPAAQRRQVRAAIRRNLELGAIVSIFLVCGAGILIELYRILDAADACRAIL